MLVRIIELFDVPYLEVDDALEKAGKLEDGTGRPMLRPYNLTGRLLFPPDVAGTASYAVRVSDLEGVRRLAVLIAELRLRGVDAGDVAGELEGFGIRHPYTNEPFEWDGESKAAVFNGLESGDRGRHALLY